MTPVERINRFIDARTGMRGLDPDIVHGVNTNGEQENLTLPDLRALLADLERAEKALEKIAAIGGEWGPFPETKPEWAAMAIVTARETLDTLTQMAGR